MKKVVVFAFLAVMLFCGCRSVVSEDSFTLATFNIRCPVDKTPHSWQERLPRCIAVIEKNKFDIFGVQEAYLQQIYDLLGDKFSYIGKGRTDFKDKGEFSAIIFRKSRFKLLKGGTFGLSEQPDVPGLRSWGSACPRIATWGLFEDMKTGKTFIYYNTHLDHVSELARINGIKLLVKHAGENAKGKPLVISGDFNARTTSETYKTAAGLLKDSALISHISHTGPQQTYNGYGKSKNFTPIDFIFVSEDFDVLTHHTDDTKFPEGFPSDHYPVITKLMLK